MGIPTEICQRCLAQNENAYGAFASLCRDELPRSHRVTIPLGPMSDLLERHTGCKFCYLFVSAISTAWKVSPPPTEYQGRPIRVALCNRVAGVVVRDGTELRYSENFAANDYEYSICRLVLEIKLCPPGYPSEVEIQAVDSGPGINGLFDDAPLFHRRPDANLDSINLDLVSSWIKHCIDSHRGACVPDPVPAKCTDAYAKSFRLIDVNTMCIVDAAPTDTYAALSYVWGKAKVLQLLKENKHDIYGEKAFDSDANNLPKTIRDAIYVTRKLGIPYIWVDALCIMQNDIDEKSKVIGEMDLVYSRATLTIVAASGSHADAGLPGLNPGERATCVFDNEVSIPNSTYRLAMARPGPSIGIGQSPWNGRGWTYQERLCSHRILVFTEQQVFFYCSKAAWCEDTVLETDNPNVYYGDQPLHTLNLSNDKTNSFMRDVEEASSKSMFEEYCKLVDEYTCRNLSFQSDIQDAFTGALRRFQMECQDKGTDLHFIFGVPTMWLELSMHWNHLPGPPKHERRDVSIRLPSGATIPVPSWSWMGWTGGVEMGRQGIVITMAIEATVQPEVKWYYVDETGAALQHLPTSASTHPKPSWLQTSDSPRVLRERWKPKGALTDVTLEELSSFTPESLAGKLVFYTSTASLPVTEHHLSLSTTKSVTDYHIGSNKQGSILLDPEFVSANPTGLFEFIVIARSATDDWKAPGKCDSLDLLLVERRVGIVYRIAKGGMPESAWVEEDHSWNLVVLG